MQGSSKGIQRLGALMHELLHSGPRKPSTSAMYLF